MSQAQRDRRLATEAHVDALEKLMAAWESETSEATDRADALWEALDTLIDAIEDDRHDADAHLTAAATARSMLNKWRAP